jgi:hypothetical protein
VPVVLLAIGATAPPAVAASQLASDNPIGVHSMLYLTHPFSAKEAMFKEAAAVGASTIRLDVFLAGVFPNPTGPPDWSGVDQYMLLARRYHLRVLADLLATPSYLVDCPADASPDLYYRCPPTNPALWGHDAGVIAAHTRGVIDDFEIINEPDGGWAFYGTPQQYAQILSASYDAIHAADPQAKVALGGLMNITSHAWIEQVLNTPGADAIHRFDIANIHVRTDATAAGALVRDWRNYLARKGFAGPLWVTETGYPADPAWQTDLAYQGGAVAQARWLKTAIPAMICAGAAKVFVTERDSLTGPFASEGFLQSTDPLTADPAYTRRPSFYALRALAHGSWRTATAREPGCAADHPTQETLITHPTGQHRRRRPNRSEATASRHRGRRSAPSTRDRPGFRFVAFAQVGGRRVSV